MGVKEKQQAEIEATASKLKACEEELQALQEQYESSDATGLYALHENIVLYVCQFE